MLEEVRHLVAHHPHRGAEEGGLRLAAPPGGFAAEEGGHRREGGHRPGREVEEGRPAAHRPAVRVAGDRHDPAVCLHERFVPRVLRLGAAPPEGGDRGVDEAGVERRDVVVPEPEPLHVPGLEVLDQHVRGPREVPHDGRPGLGLEIDRDALLVGVEGEEGGAQAVLVGRPLPSLVPAEVLDLDHLRPEEGEEHRAVGSGEDPRAVEHPDPGKRGIGAGRVGTGRGIGHGRVSSRRVTGGVVARPQGAWERPVRNARAPGVARRNIRNAAGLRKPTRSGQDHFTLAESQVGLAKRSPTLRATSFLGLQRRITLRPSDLRTRPAR